MDSVVTKHILIVDNDPISRRFFGSLLASAGYEVIYANSGMQGREMARRLVPDLILMDIEMPGGEDGFITAKRIKNESDSLVSGIPIVFLTNADLPTEIQKWMVEFGVTSYIQKGVSNEEFVKQVKTIFETIKNKPLEK